MAARVVAGSRRSPSDLSSGESAAGRIRARHPGVEATAPRRAPCRRGPAPLSAICVGRSLSVAALLAGTALTAPAAVAQTWVGTTSDYNDAANWTPATIPLGSGGTASFGATGSATVTLSSSVSVGTIEFASNAQAYTLDLTGSVGLSLRGGGIVNNSGVTQTISAHDLSGGLAFNGTSSAADTRMVLTGVTILVFDGNSSAGTANISFDANVLNVSTNATLANATIELSGFSWLRFFDSASGGQAAVTLSDAGAELFFQGYSGTGTTLGSLAGSGQVHLADGGTAKSLTIGGNNQSTTFSGTIDRGGSIIKEGSGTLNLTGSNSYGGGTRIDAGTLGVGSNTALGTGGLVMANGTTLQATAATVTLANAITLDGTGTIDTQANNLGLSGTIDGSGTLAKTGSGRLVLTGSNSYSGGTQIDAGTLGVATNSALGTGAVTMANGTTLEAATSLPVTLGNAITLNGAATFDAWSGSLTLGGVIDGSGSLTKTGTQTLVLTGANTYGGGTTVGAGTLQGNTTSLQGDIVNNAAIVFDQATNGTYGGALSGTGTLTKQGAGTLTMGTAGTYSGATTVAAGTLTGRLSSASAYTIEAGATLRVSQVLSQIGSLAGSGTVDLAASLFAGNDNSSTTFSGTITGTWGFTKTGTGTLTLAGTNNATGTTSVQDGTLRAGAVDVVGQSANMFVSGAGTFDLAGFDQTVGSLSGPASIATILLGSATLTVGTDNSSPTLYGGSISGSGGLTKVGTGTQTLGGSSTYTGATNVNGGTLRAAAANALAGASAHTVAAGATLDLNGFSQTIGSLAGAGSTTLGAATLTAGGNNGSTTYSGAITGPGSLVKVGSGLLNLTGNSTIGSTTVSAGTLAVNAALTGNVTVGAGGTLGGSGTITGLVTNNGIVAPGNSIGTLNIAGNYVQTAGSTYQVEVNAAGQGDRIVATGTASLAGSVQVIAANGSYARNTTYTILTATGGISGAYAGVTANLAFLTPSLSYDANNVYLLLLQSSSAFASGAQTSNQVAVGTALDRANASAAGDFNTVLNALSGLTMQQGPAALNAISGQPYANFGTGNVAGGLLFMNTVGTQAAVARNAGRGNTLGLANAGNRVVLDEACDVACESTEPSKWGAWMSGLAGLGSVGGNGSNSGAFNYNFGGVAAGIDYRIDPSLLVGATIGYASGQQWVQGFQGTGWSSSYNAALYASFVRGGFYTDGLAGFAWADNAMTRSISIPGLATRVATGYAGASQFMGQVEAGYRFGIYEPAKMTLSPFARFQAVAVSQGAFSESGANSLNLNVAQQNTTSIRTVLGADLGAAMPLPNARTLDVAVRLGWAHEYANTSRPMTASFAGAPAIPFTIYGAQPLADAAVVGLGLQTKVADGTSLYARYDGEVTGRDNAHVFSAGFRLTW